MIPSFNTIGNLPPGIYWVSWAECVQRYGINPHRQKLLHGLKAALDVLRKAGCSIVYINGSFVNCKDKPADFDCCWNTNGVNVELLDPVLMELGNLRAAQKAKFY